MELGLTGRVAIVTGGSEGIGRGTALSLAREGVRVVIAARRPDVLTEAAEAIERETGSPVLAVPTDVLVPEDLERLVARTEERFGPPTIIVNNAGQASGGPFERLTDEEWRWDLDLKFMAAVRLIRLTLPGMQAARDGRIVNVTNIGAKTPGANSLPTTVSRAAGIAMTKALSREYARHNIRVNTVCIGRIKSAQTDRNTLADFPGRSQADAYAQAGRYIPLGRVGETEEAADVITFLVSDRAAFITGVALNIDGGASPVT